MPSDVLIVDDEADIRELVAGILEDEGHGTRTAADADQALVEIGRRRPSLVFLDIWLQGSRLDGLALLDEIAREFHEVPVVMISGHGNIETAVAAIKKGAYDFIEKPFKEEELLGLVERMLDQARNAFSQHQEQASRDALLSRLTTREAQVLERIVAGRLNKQIADDLGISIKTVEAHRANVMEKLNANTVADLLKIALGASGQQQPPAKP